MYYQKPHQKYHPPTRITATQRELGAPVQPLKLTTINHPPLMKSNTVTRFKIISGLRNSHSIISGFLYAAIRLLEGFLLLVSVFKEASQNLILKTIGTYTESTDVIF
jgi:hypothetical protein